MQALELTIILPSYADAAAATLFERDFERKANNEAFSSAFHRLFHILACWDRSPESELGVYLFDVYSPSDPRPTLGMIGRYRYSYLLLEQPGELPIVPCMTGIDLRIGLHRLSERRIAPQVGIELLAKMPNARFALIAAPNIWMESRYPAIRRTNRDAFVSALSNNPLPTSVDDFLGLNLDRNSPSDQTWQPLNLLSDGAQSDPASSAIWNAASKLNRLRKLRIEGCIDSSLLWPGPFGLGLKSLPDPVPFWQGLTTMVIRFDLITPSGEWYFRAPDGIDIHSPPFLPPDEPHPIDIEPAGATDADMPPGYGSDESRAIGEFNQIVDILQPGVTPRWTFRLVPEERLLYPLIEAWSRAVSQMPRISKAILATDLDIPRVDDTNDVHCDWKITYISPCHCSNCSVGFTRPGEIVHRCTGRKMRALWLKTLGWRPEGALLELLRGIGSRYHDCGIEESFHADDDFLELLGL